MKKYLLPLLLIALVYVACDKVENTRELNTKGTNLSPNAVIVEGDTLTVVEDPDNANKHVLLEEFTGHLCGTCPPAAKVLDTLRLQFGAQLVTLAIHSGQFADTCPTALDCPSSAPSGSFQTNYRSVAGDAWTTAFGITANPLGMIDRIGFPSTHKKTYSTWRTNIQNELALASVAKINIKTLYDAANRKAKTAVKTQLLQNSTDTLLLSIALVEDSVVDWQQWYGHSPQYVQDYVHHDILRGTFNGITGETFRPDTANSMIVGYSMPVSTRWNPAKCKVIAFLYKKSNYTVVQVTEAELQ